MDILILNMYSARPLSLNGKEGTTRDSFQQEITLAGLSQWEICRRSWTQQERWDNQGLISMGNNRFTIPGLSQWENIRRSWIQRERMGNQGFIWMGNYKFRSIKLEVRVSGYMDILILNTYPARPLSLSMGKKGQPGTHFNGKLQVKLEVGISGFMDILILNTYSARSLSLSMGKKGQPEAHFNGKSQVYNTWLISVGKYQKKLNSMGKKG